MTTIPAAADITAAERAVGGGPASGAAELSPEQRRLCDGIPDRVKYIHHECFALPETEQRLFGRDVEPFDVPLWSPSGDAGSGLQPARQMMLSVAQEVTLFLQYNYARYRLDRLLASRGSRGCLRLAREMVLWHGRAMKARANLVRANLALVYAMVKRTRVAGVETAELVSEGNLALLRSVEKFDVSRGFRFSTYACRSILKGLGRLAKRIQRRRKRVTIQLTPNLDFRDSAAQKHERRWQESLETLREILKKNQARLSEIEQTIVNERFALKTGGKARTLAQVAQMVGLTDERVRQLQIVALAKIRAALERTACAG